MRLDENLLRKQLENIEEWHNPLADIDNQQWSDETKKDKEEIRQCGHLRFLIEERYVEGIVLRRGIDGHFSVGFPDPRLTKAGYNFLKDLRLPKIREENQTSNSHITNYIFNSDFQGIAGDIRDSEVTQSFSTINEGNKTNLTEVLRKLKIEDFEIKNLLDIIDEDPPLKNKRNFSTKVGDWIGKMIGKAINGAWNIGVSTTTSMLTKAISQYYGLI